MEKIVLELYGGRIEAAKSSFRRSIGNCRSRGKLPMAKVYESMIAEIEKQETTSKTTVETRLRNHQSFTNPYIGSELKEAIINELLPIMNYRVMVNPEITDEDFDSEVTEQLIKKLSLSVNDIPFPAVKPKPTDWVKSDIVYRVELNGNITPFKITTVSDNGFANIDPVDQNVNKHLYRDAICATDINNDYFWDLADLKVWIQSPKGYYISERGYIIPCEVIKIHGNSAIGIRRIQKGYTDTVFVPEKITQSDVGETFFWNWNEAVASQEKKQRKEMAKHEW